MKQWVTMLAGQIEQGPIVQGEAPGPDWIEYEERIDLPRNHGPVTVRVEVVGGKCVKSVVANVHYSEQRREEYPDLAEQLGMFWHAMDRGEFPKVEPFYTQIKAVKARFPKG